MATSLHSLYAVRDQILDNAKLDEASVLLDVGAGDGLIAFGALERLKPDARVIFSDISSPLIKHARELAAQLGVSNRVDFVVADAGNLNEVPSGTVDVVTTRSVLIYVKEKQAAFREFFRVLRAKGRISLAEPINRIDDEIEIPAAAPEIADLHRLLRNYERSSVVAFNPMLDFNERDLVRMAYEAGFTEVHADLRIDIEPRQPMLWETYLNVSPNPNATTMREYYSKVFTEDQFRRYEAYMKPLTEAGKVVRCRAMSYLWARKS